MAQEFTVGFTTTAFNEHYTPAQGSRLTTNFANLARGERRQENLRAALTMIDRRVNTLVPWDNPTQDRYAVELEIVSAHLQRAGQAAAEPFPLLEMLQTRILDRATGTHHPGIVGNNFSSYVRDYDFSVRLPSLRGEDGAPRIPEDFGDLHGGLFQRVLASEAYRARFARPPVICISVSTSRTYRRTANVHPVLGVEYEQGEGSLTDAYFAKMGLRVRYFMPPGSVAPLAFYSCGDLLGDHSLLALAGPSARWRPSRRSTVRRSTTPMRRRAWSTAPASAHWTTPGPRSTTTARSATGSEPRRGSTRWST